VVDMAMTFRARMLGAAWPDAEASLGALVAQLTLRAPQRGNQP
jgi:hypothetical protein